MSILKLIALASLICFTALQLAGDKVDAWVPALLSLIVLFSKD